MRPEIKKGIHPTIKKCLQHLDILQANDKTKQIVYMYMESLLLENTKSAKVSGQPAEVPVQADQ
ncbi:hypothetical protein [Bacillus sp. J33]|uniref:hypothetical protein n=1 Tax=Bacillus sp. J33 TaxID=935836 RepID=UPI00047DFD47|nr:hypothetical protein [Bacillus sp. J33]